MIEAGIALRDAEGEDRLEVAVLAVRDQQSVTRIVLRDATLQYAVLPGPGAAGKDVPAVEGAGHEEFGPVVRHPVVVAVEAEHSSIEASEPDLLVGMPCARLVEARDDGIVVGALEGRQRGIGGGPRVQDGSLRPVATAVATATDRHVGPPLRIRGVREDQDAAAVRGHHRCLADRLGQGGVPGHGAPGVATVGRTRQGPGSLRAIVVPHVQEQGAVLQLGDGTLIDLMGGGSTGDLPGPAVVVARDAVRVVVLRVGLDVIAGDQEAACMVTRSQLDAVAGPGRVPGPVGLLRGGGDLPGFAPRGAVVVAGQHPHRPGALGGPGDDLGLMVLAEVAGGEQVDSSVAAVEHRARVPAGVSTVVPDHVEITPGPAAVATAFEDEVDVPGVAAAADPSFGEREQRAVGGLDQGRDAEGVVAVVARGEDRRVVGRTRLHGHDERQEEKGDGRDGETEARHRRMVPVPGRESQWSSATRWGSPSTRLARPAMTRTSMSENDGFGWWRSRSGSRFGGPECRKSQGDRETT